VGKPAGKVGSYRPVSLTSCVVKTLERMIWTRLYTIAETRGMLHPTQAGFRKGRSCVDQILRISQAISDGFQEKKTGRTVMVLLDFSQAFDRVWREDLLGTLVEKGVPMQFVNWINSFLQNHQARVLLNNVLSHTRCIRHGVPQGSVLAPLLFLFGTPFYFLSTASQMSFHQTYSTQSSPTTSHYGHRPLQREGQIQNPGRG
jgi:hypothetical protein